MINNKLSYHCNLKPMDKMTNSPGMPHKLPHRFRSTELIHNLVIQRKCIFSVDIHLRPLNVLLTVFYLECVFAFGINS